MRYFSNLVFAAVGIAVSGTVFAQLDDPVPEPIVNRGLAVRVQDVVRLPDSTRYDPAGAATTAGYARVSYVKDAPDGRRFANDSRGFLYILDGSNAPALYLNFREAMPLTVYRGLESGFIGFEFHPEFADNGLFYTTHIEQVADNPATPDFIPPGFTLADATYFDVVTEWRASDPAAASFDGTHRELLRVAHIVVNPFHAIGHLTFNPTAAPGDDDYGLLYIGSTDLGFSNGGGPHEGDPTQTQRLDTLLSAILRIDPRSPAETGGTKGVGDYTIPAINHFAADGDPNTFGEIYAYGFRNPHRMSWDLSDGTLFAMDIGMSQIEEVNIVHEGQNYGWFRREGYFDNGIHHPGRNYDYVYALPEMILDGSMKDGFTYPVAIFDHGEGVAITNGFVYRGSVPALRGKFVFGGIRGGRLFAADVAAMKAADDGIPRTVAPVEEIQLYVAAAGGRREDMTFWQIVEQALGRSIARADLHISEGSDGEIYITSRQDGWIRMLAAD